MNENWTKWFLSSIYNHYSTTLTDAFVEGIIRKETSPSDRFELKTIGPDYVDSGQEILVRIELNILVVTGTELTKPLKHVTRIGLAQTVFPNCLNIYKNGSLDTDDKSLFATMQRDSGVNTTHFIYDPVAKLMRSTTDTVYTVHLDRNP